MLPVNRLPERRVSWFFAVPLFALFTVLSAGPASAHTRLVETTPADGKQLTRTPDEVSLTFSEGVLKLGATIKISGPDGTTKHGAVKVRNRTVSWPLTGDLANGKYTVDWRVTSADGHPIDGTFDFAIRVQPTASPTAAGASPTAVPTPTVHTAEPQMTGPMPGMEGMPGMATQPSTPVAATRSSSTTVVAIAGLLLLTAMVAGAIVIERRRRPRPGAGPSATAND
jgi:methionine-rich copper-binding protein CopC